MTNEFKDYEEMLEALYDESEISGTAMSKWERDFVQSVSEQYQEKKWISDTQNGIILKIHEKMFG